MKKFATALVAVSLFALAACADTDPRPVNPNHPGANTDCPRETQAGDCVPGKQPPER